jgi:hypothetical protein
MLEDADLTRPGLALLRAGRLVGLLSLSDVTRAARMRLGGPAA